MILSATEKLRRWVLSFGGLYPLDDKPHGTKPKELVCAEQHDLRVEQVRSNQYSINVNDASRIFAALVKRDAAALSMVNEDYQADVDTLLADLRDLDERRSYDGERQEDMRQGRH